MGGGGLAVDEKNRYCKMLYGGWIALRGMPSGSRGFMKVS